MAPSVPEFDTDQAALGQWVDHKFPRGVYTRRWLAGIIWRVRANLSRTEAAQLRRELLVMISNLERDALKMREKMRRDLERMPHIGPLLLEALDGGGTPLEVLRAIDGLAAELKAKGGIQ